MARERHYYLDPNRMYSVAIYKNHYGNYEWYVYRGYDIQRWFASGESESVKEAKRQAREALAYTLMRGSSPTSLRARR